MRARTHERYIEISRRANPTSDTGAAVLTVMVIACSATSVHRFLLAVILNVLLIGCNIAVNKLVVPRLGARGDVARSVFNGVAAAIIYPMIGWPLPVWFWLPFVAITFDQAAGARFALLNVVLLSSIQGAAALIDGQRLLEPIVFTVLSLIGWAISRARSQIILEMLEAAEAQRDALVAEVAARERVEIELRNAQKLEALGRLAAGIAHEINSPMQFISNSVQFVREGVDDLLDGDEEDRAYLAEQLPKALSLAVDGCERITKIVRSMKQFAHVDGEKTTVDLNSAIDATLAIATHEYKHVADVARELHDLPQIACNAGEINQVLINLITNAAHAIENRVGASGERGTITLETSVNDNDVLISIGDNGTGIPVAFRDRIFDPFFTTKEVGRGTGQGLSISRAVVERHGGKLTFETAIGVGTTFHVVLPIAA
jgi:signal transduction histidine kinase